MAYDMKTMHPDDARELRHGQERRRHSRIFGESSNAEGRARELRPDTDGFVERQETQVIVWDKATSKYRYMTADELVTPPSKLAKRRDVRLVAPRQGNNRHKGGS